MAAAPGPIIRRLNDSTSVTFSYAVTDGVAAPVATTASLDITPVNDAPVTSPVTLAAIAEDSGPRLITQAELLANASDVDGPGLSAVNLAISSGNGTLDNNGNGTWTYHPALNDSTVGDVQLCRERRDGGPGCHHGKPRHHAGERCAGGCQCDRGPGHHTGQRVHIPVCCQHLQRCRYRRHAELHGDAVERIAAAVLAGF